jgi:glycine/D-amino acid oxidase-like deaminating enzyme
MQGKMTKNAIVLGAGIVGVSTAIHLQRRGWQVTLIDRKEPGNETSFGNAGLIQREGVMPYGFPQQLGLLLRYALNNRIDAHYHLKALPSQLAFLARYWWNSNPKRHEMITKAYAPLIENSITEHKDLIEASHAEALIRRDGWMKIFRTEAKRDEAFVEAALWKDQFGVSYESLNSANIARLEPNITGDFVGGLRWVDPWSVLDPHALTRAYRSYFESLGGRFVTGRIGLEDHDIGGVAGGRRCRAGTRPLGSGRDAPPRLFLPARRQARLPHALWRAGQCCAQQLDARFRARLFPGADEQGRAPDNGGGIRNARCAEDAGAARPGRSGGAHDIPAG